MYAVCSGVLVQIVVLDEATSSLDPETAARIHDTIRLTFYDCTLMIIAHSMRTVLQCDRVLVIDAGQVFTSRLQHFLPFQQPIGWFISCKLEKKIFYSNSDRTFQFFSLYINCSMQYKKAQLTQRQRATALHVKNGFWREIGTQGHLFCNQLQADKGQHIAM